MRNTYFLPEVPRHQHPLHPRKAGGYGAGNNIVVGATIFSSVLVTMYLCAYCGLSEEWVDDRADLVKLGAKYCG